MWKTKEQYIDARQGVHVVNMHNVETKAEHQGIILLHHRTCPSCTRVSMREAVKLYDPNEIIANELAILNESHENMRDYAKKHGLKLGGR